ncbi:stalk domain-containing protein [Crassaminicella profunda]|uniref:stalk domain-containing protein n=1 Tax=Crassaminicella profunda TaxID=1286698 RepID=UPI001CA618E8|nr:stalk domain-containing protein [Crassaminicella profunda]QZY55495.1 TolC family protein [Crassaminicella profunda]
MYKISKKIACTLAMAAMLSCNTVMAMETIKLPVEMKHSLTEDVQFVIGDGNYKVGNIVKSIPVPSYIKDKSPMLPLDLIIEMMGISKDRIDWKPETKTVTIFKDNQIIQMTIGKNTLIIDGNKMLMDTALEIKDGNTMIPIDFIEKVFDKKVSFNSITNKITIPVKKKMKPEENSNTWDYTYEMMLKKALDSSKDLKSAEMNVERTDSIKDDAKDDTEYIPTRYGSDVRYLKGNVAYLKYEKDNFEYELAKKKVDMIKDKIAYDVKNAYYEVLKDEDNKKLAKLAMDLTQEKAHLIDLSHREGFASDIENNQAKRDYEEAKKQYDLAVKELDKAYEKLNDLVRLDTKERYTLKDEVIFDANVEEDVDYHIARVIDKSPEIWALNEIVDLKDLNVDLYVFNLPVDYKWSFDMDPYEAKEIDAKMATVELGKVKQQYEQGLRELYTSLNQLKDQYEKYKITYEKAKDDLKMAKVNVAVGNELPITEKKAVLQLENSKKQLRETIMYYNKWAMMYNKPWIKSVSKEEKEN